MARLSNRIGRGIARLTAAATLLMLGTGGTTQAGAAERVDIYHMQTIVTGQREETRGVGLATCLKDLLVKATGDPRLLDDPKVQAMAGEAANFVVDFRYHDRMEGKPVHDEQGTRDRPYDLIVDFDPAKIDAALRSLGRKTWDPVRPRVAVIFGVDNGARTYMLASDGDMGRDERYALGEAAVRRGVPVALPSAAALAEAGVRYETVPAADPAKLDALARSAGGDVALTGRMVWSDQENGWIADWRLRAGTDKTVRWQVHALNFDEGFRRAMSGAAQILSGNGQPE
ncbi:MAG TPA: DUF2066 domain-containing protein [Stellaceae bacterium]|jgi:hypothetical protein